MEKKVTIKHILNTIDCFSNLDDCYTELKEALQDYIGYEIVE